MTIDAIVDTFSARSEVELEQRFGISSPYPLICIIASYLLIILKIAPSYMKSRPAYSLKTFMIFYNIFQVAICIYLIYKIYVINIPTIAFWKCDELVPKSIEEREFNHISIVAFWLKVIELSETLVFVLRKKQRQVSFLHVFHHCSTLFLVYQLIVSYKGSSALYPLFLNCNVHVIMYIYYLMAAVLPDEIVARLLPVKRAITTIQMIQFAMILIQVAVALSRGCRVPTGVLVIYVGIITIFFYLFYDFYKKNYNEKKQAAADAKKKRQTSN